VRQTLRFDEAVRAAVNFAMKDGRTLVIATADHETGGMSLEKGNGAGEVKVKWSDAGHTNTPVPLFAYGPGAKQFAGTYENTEVPRRIAKLLGVREFAREMKP
jgi:alkaline phosphatase